MKIGTVVNIRVSPQNCMAINDAIKLAGLEPHDFTFASAVSRVLDMMMDSLRRDKLIPTRDGFELSDMMSEFIAKKKAALPSVSYRAPMQPTQAVNYSQGAVNYSPGATSSTTPVITTAEQRLANLRFKELMVKKEHAPGSWTAEDALELETVMAKL